MKTADFVMAVLKAFLPYASQNEKSWIIPNYIVSIMQKYLLPAAESDAERACMINKIFGILGDLKAMSFFVDIVAIVQPTIVANIEKCNADDSKQQLREGIESFLNVLPDTESKNLFAQLLTKLWAKEIQ